MTTAARRSRSRTEVMLAATLLGLACVALLVPDVSARAVPPDATSEAAAPAVVEVEVMDFAFRLPKTVPAGVTTIRLVNRGRHLHHMQIVRLDDGHTISELLKLWRPGVATPSWMTGVGGPTAAIGGQTLEGVVLLRPGTYGVLCWVPAADGHLHFEKGMFGQFDVVSAATATVDKVSPVTALPPADVQITMLDYGWVLPTVTRGRHTVRVFNGGPQDHELVLVRLAPGRTAHDAAAWAERGQTGDVPGTMLGGVAALAPGGVAQFTADFSAGQHALICFVPDQRDGKGRPHTEHGMLRQFEVR